MSNINLGPHLRTPNPGFNPGFTPAFVIKREGQLPGLNPVFGILRFGLWLFNRTGVWAAP
jgi:hypothetical protein